jgi:hypothetical protein
MNGSRMAALVRGWAGLYTRGLPAQLRDARRDEVDDDLWCQHEEAAALGRPARSLGAEMFLRLLLGMPADISWRLADHANAPVSLERRSSMGTRIVGLLTIVAVLLLMSGMFLSSLVGEDALWAWGGALVIAYGWMISFIAAALGLALLFQDRVGPLGGFGAIVVTFGTLTTMGGFIAPIFVGSAMLMWDLARIGVVSRLVQIVHVATAIVVVATAIGFNAGMPGQVGGALVILYLLTWLWIGVSLIRGVALPRATSA